MLRRNKLFILMLLMAPAAAPGDMSKIGGYAQANKLYTEGWTGVRYEIMSPFFSVPDALLSISMKINTRGGRIPDNVVCSLRRDFRHVPADLHAVPADDGGLGLSFEQLDSYTHIKFIVAWPLEPKNRVYPHSATIRTNGEFWEKSSERIFGRSIHENDAIPVQIVIDGAEDCRLM